MKGLDFSEVAVRKAREKGIHAEVCNLDEGIPERSNSYNIVWAGDILEHVFDPIGLLNEVRRALKPNGILLLTIPSDVGLVTRIKVLLGYSYQEEMYRENGYYRHHTFFSPSLIRVMLQKAGLTLERFEKILILGSHKAGRRFHVNYLPSMFFNEMAIQARK